LNFRCLCVPDAIESQRFVISCKWTKFSADADLFAQFPHNVTKTLNVECSSEQSSTLYDGIFSAFTTLQNLRIQKCDVRSLSKGIFRGLVNLRSLYLDQMAHNDQPLTISEGIFNELNRLEKIAITNSQLGNIPNNAFCATPNLQVINVSSNWLHSANIGISSECSVGQLLILDLSNNRIQSIGSTDLSALAAIRQLSLANNQIEHIDREAFHANTLLQHLDIESNRIQEMPLVPESVIDLNAANNRLSIISNTMANLPNLISLNLSVNSIDASTPFPIAASGLEILDLSFNRFENIPISLIDNSAPSLTHLNMRSNRIEQIPPNTFDNFTRLQTLDLTSNRISELMENCFTGLEELTKLYISNNSIFQIGVTSFDPIVQLTELDLSRNVLLEVPLAIGRLFKLKQLILSRNQISKTYKFLFNKLPHLYLLDLSYNKIASIESYVFSDLVRLNELSLSHNSIDQLAQDAFVKCPKLRQIDLSSNFLTSFNGALTKVLNLKRLNVSANLVEILQWNEFPIGVTHLDITNNRIALIGSASNSRIKNAQLQNNRIMVLSAEQIPSSVERLDVSNNSIQVVSNGTFSGKSHLRSIDIRNNRLNRIEHSSFAVDNLLSSSSIHLYVDGNPLLCTCEMDWLRRSATSGKSVIEIVDEQQAVCLHRLDKRHIILAHVTRDQFLCSYRQDLPMYATHVYLERMNLEIIRSHDFLGRMRLIQLYINSSSVRQIQPLAFNTLSSLQLLDLSGNELTQLTGDEMYRTQKVTHLFLNDNRISSFDDRIKEVMPALQLITLHGNKLQDLPPVIEQFGERLARVSLSANPYRCDCGNRFRMQSWLPQNAAKVIDSNDILCVENITWAFRNNDTTVLSAYPPNQNDNDDIFIMPMQEFINSVNTTICVPTANGIFGGEGASNSILMIVVAFAVLSMLIGFVLIAITLLKRTHYAMAQRRYKAPPSLNCSQTTPGSTPLPLLHFDAFVSYAKKDEKFIIESLCRQLEAEDYLLCLLHRDGPSYNTRLHAVSDELISQMECAQSLIFVLTEQFLENEWKTLQIKTSHQLFAKNRHKKLIALLGDGIEPNRLDAELGQILRKNTCIRMNDPLFWNLLHSALPIRLAPSSCSADSSQIYSDCYGSIVPSDIV
uniref:TIR domain-containing protein n=1 Tax=Anisakis simplex TaxID=6269 RepID=A0A158PNA5_ANISI